MALHAQDAAGLLQNLSIDSQQLPADASASAAGAQNQQEVVEGADGEVSEAGEGRSPAASDYAAAAVVYYSPSPNSYAQQPVYYGYDGAISEYEEFSGYVNPQGVEMPATGVYGDNCSVLYRTGYGYSSQMQYAPYSPNISGDGQLYGSQQFQYLADAPFYQQPVSSSIHCMPSSSSVDVSNSGIVDHINYSTDGLIQNGNGVYGNSSSPLHLHLLHSQYGRGFFPLSIPTSPSYTDPRVSISAAWPDSPNFGDNPLRNISTSSYATALTSSGSLRQNVGPVPHMSTQVQRGPQQLSPCGNGTTPGLVNRFYTPSRTYPPNNKLERSDAALHNIGFDSRSNARSRVGVDRSGHRGRGLFFNVNVSGKQDVLNERNRGPHTLRFRNQQMESVVLPGKEEVPIGNGNTKDNNLVPNRERYNLPDFRTSYPNTILFIIKSYSEDDIHKSIKYNVWASTPNGNKKLNAAYQEAKERTDECPVFLFFSVNASGQFCGVAEMIGEVDFTRTVKYWQQDKWTGSFPLKWVIIKDVPNAQLRHIILDNNDNKPVTNSRDTQEVKSEQGTEMLNIFKNYVCKSSILDDFPYYEARQLAIQERKAQEQEISCSGEESGAVSLEDAVIDVEESSACAEVKYNIQARLKETTDLTSDSSGSTKQSCDEGFGNQLNLDSGLNERSDSYVVAGDSDDATERKLQLNA